MRAFLLLVICAVSAPFAQVSSSQPTIEEIKRAHHVTSSIGVPFTNRAVELRRVREIRGWKLKYRKESEERYPGVWIIRESAYATKNGVCARYRITDTIVVSPNPQMRSSFLVEAPITCQ